MSTDFFKTARAHTREFEAFRVWAVTPLGRPDPRTPGITHDCVLYADRGDDSPWRLCQRAPGAYSCGYAPEEEGHIFEALPVIDRAALDEMIGIPAYVRFLETR